MDDDDKEDEANLLSTAPASLTSGLKNNEPDWLSDLGLGGPPPKVKDAERPRSVGSAAKGESVELNMTFNSIIINLTNVVEKYLFLSLLRYKIPIKLVHQETPSGTCRTTLLRTASATELPGKNPLITVSRPWFEIL